LLVERRKDGWARKKRRREPAHRELPDRFEEAYRAAHRLACQEWSVRQFSGLGRTVAQDRRCDCWRLPNCSRCAVGGAAMKA